MNDAVENTVQPAQPPADVPLEMCRGRVYIAGDRKFERYETDGRTLKVHWVSPKVARFLLRIGGQQPYFRQHIPEQDEVEPTNVTAAGIVPEELLSGQGLSDEDPVGPSLDDGAEAAAAEEEQPAPSGKRTRNFSRRTKAAESKADDGDDGEEV